MKKDNYLNIWVWRHPFKSIKRAWWRITRGYCPYDVWDWYNYMAHLMHDSLYYLANNHMGTMLEYQNKDLEYTDKLKEIADKILHATNYDEDYDNPFREDYYKDLENVKLDSYVDESGNKHTNLSFNNTSKELFNNYLHVEEKNYARSKKDLKEAFNWIYDHWFELWD